MKKLVAELLEHFGWFWEVAEVQFWQPDFLNSE
jgi:hypothetical protein